MLVEKASGTLCEAPVRHLKPEQYFCDCVEGRSGEALKTDLQTALWAAERSEMFAG